MGKNKLAIKYASAIVCGSFLTALCSFVKDLLISASVGLTETYGSFLFLFSVFFFIPNLVFGSIANSLIKNAQIPENNLKLFNRELIKKTIILSLISTVLTGAIFKFLPLKNLYSFQSQNDLIIIWLVYQFFTSINSIFKSSLLINDKQFLYTVINSILPLSIIVIFLVDSNPSLIDLTIFCVIAVLIEFLILIFSISKKTELLTSNRQFSFLSRETILLIIASIFYSLCEITDGYILVDNNAIGISTLSFASKIYFAYLLIIALPLGQLSLSKIDLFSRISLLVIAISLLFSTVLYLFSYEVVYYLFYRGKFSEANLIEVNNLQRVYSLMIIPFAMALVAARYSLLIGKAHYLVWASGLILLFKLISIRFFYQHYGLLGIVTNQIAAQMLYLIFLLIPLLIYTKRQKLSPNRI
jgi:hypothetical protein